MAFIKATRKKAKLKLAISGPAGSGKTYSALRLASGMAGKIAVIDTENGSASLYSDRFVFDVLDIAPPFTDDKFIAAINDAVAAGYECVIIDSASHCWEGVLDFKSKLDARGGNSYTNWNEAGKKFKGILDAFLHSPIHVIACMRSKMDYVLETNDKGKQQPKKVGLAPIMRDGAEYEFTTVFDVAMSHECQTSKDRTGLFGSGIFQITEDTGKQLIAWMDSGAAPAVADPPTIAGANADIPKTTNAQSGAKWTPEQTAEMSAIRTELTQIDAKADEAFRKLWGQFKHCPPSEVIDKASELLRHWRDIQDQANATKETP